MQSFNDIANERYKYEPNNDNDIVASNEAHHTSESRSDSQNEDLASYIAQKLSSTNTLPFLAVGYSRIPRTTIDRHLTTALEKGDTPVKLFMHLISNEALWKDYQLKKSKRDEK